MIKYFLFSDVHGNYDAMKKAIDKSGFNPKNDGHFLVSLGDLFDRGKQNHLVLEYLLEMDKKDKVYAIRGNHDDFLYKFLTGENDGMHHAYYNGLGTTIENFTKEPVKNYFRDHEKAAQKIKDNYPELLPFLEKMPNSYIIGNYMLTHAGFTKVKTGEWLIDNFSDTIEFVNNYPYDDYIQIFGHWHSYELNQEFLGKETAYEPFYYKQFIGIDPYSFKSNKVFILVIKLEDGKANITKVIK